MAEKSIGYEQGFKINSSTIQQYIRKTGMRVREKIKDELKGRIISSMADIVARNRRGILGINAQYYSEGHIVLRTIGMVEIHERHSGETIKNLIRDNLNSYDMSLDQIYEYTYTTDSARSMIRSTKLTNWEALNDYADIDDDDDDMNTPTDLIQQRVNDIRCAEFRNRRAKLLLIDNDTRWNSTYLMV